MEEARKETGNKVYYASDQYDALTGADALAMMTEWPEFHLPDFRKVAESMKGRVIFDGRNIYDPEEIRKVGFEYFGIGRK
jgi:UDPglucose 6-dehydrogenase